MFTTKLRIAALSVFMGGILVMGSVFTHCDPHGYAAPAPPAAKVPKELLEKRRDIAERVWKGKMRRIIQTANGRPSDLFGWSERWLEAELALRDKKKDRIAALKAHVDRTREVERSAINQAKMGVGSDADADAATYERLNAEIRYFQAAGEAPPPSPPPPCGLEKLTPPKKKDQ